MIKKVSDLTHLDWDRVWEMNVYQFFNYLSFEIEYRKNEEKEMQKWRMNH